MMGPTGVGCLYGKRELLAEMPPFMAGGAVSDVSEDSCEFLDPPERFEAGLQNYAGVLGFARACEFLARWTGKPGGSCGASSTAWPPTLWPARNGSGSSGRGTRPAQRHPQPRDTGVGLHDAARIFDSSDNIMLRAGRRCAHSWYHRSGVNDSLGPPSTSTIPGKKSSLFRGEDAGPAEVFLDLVGIRTGGILVSLSGCAIQTSEERRSR